MKITIRDYFASLAMTLGIFLFITPVYADITTGLVGYWTMDNADINWTNNTIIDRSGNGNTGTLVGLTQASSVPGMYGQALQFNGTSTSITIPSSETLNLSFPNAFTYSVWINVTAFMANDIGSFSCIICAGEQGMIMFSGGGLVDLVPKGTVNQLLDYNFPLNKTGQWYHLVGTYDGTTEKIYLNGALVGNTPTQVATGIVGANSAPVIGAYIGNSEYFNGAIDEVRIYNRALSASDVQELYQQTSFPTPAFSPPATPQGLVSTAGTTNSIALSWTANTEPYLGNYNLYESNGGVTPQTFINAFPNPPSGQSEPYYGYSIFNWLQTKQTVQANNYLDTNGMVIANLNSSASLSALQAAFTDPAETTGGLTEYQTILGILQNPPPFLIAVIPAGTTSFQVNNLLPGNTYSFQLSAVSTAQFASPLSSAVSVTTQAVSSSTVTPEQYLPLLTPPVFKPGYTLPLLTRWGWLLDYATEVEIATNWGYALELGDIDATAVSELNNPSSNQSLMVAMANNNPSLYRFGPTIPRLSGSQIPSSAYDVNASGNITTEFSPQAPDSDLISMAAEISSNLQQLTSKAPVAVLLDGGERYMDVAADGESYWEADPTVMAAVQSLYGTSNPADVPWANYSAQQKAHQEMFFTNAAHALTNAIYIYYPTGDQYRTDANENGGLIWDWDYKWMNTVADYPGGSCYWNQFNTGWTGHVIDSDLLSQGLNAYGYDSTFGHPLSYNWVNSGWGNNDGGGGEGFGDMQRYYGYLKSYYTAGMIGGIAGYFDYPTGGFGASFNSNAPPNWLLQMVALSQVHAEFSYLEDMLRNGTLLPGPDMSYQTIEQPAYEFRTGNYDTRVIVRKMNGQLRWLISAWAADDVTRTINVSVPSLGTVTLVATPAGSVYDGRIVNGVMSLTLLDGGSENPSLSMQLPTSMPDPDGTGVLVPPLVHFATDHYTYTAPATIVLSAIPSATTGANITSVAFYNGPILLGTATSPNTANTYIYTWTNVAVGNYSLTAIAYGSNGASTTSTVWNIIVNAPAGNGALGDVNGAVNGSGQPVVTIVDAELTAQYAIGLAPANFNAAAAMVSSNTETKPSIYDAYLIAEYAIGLINKFPVQQ